MRGDAESRFVDLYRRHEEAIRRYCIRRIDIDDVDDAVLEIFAVAWRHADRVPDDDTALLWLYAVSRNVIRNRRRTLARKKRLKSKVESIVGTTVAGPEALVVRSVDEKLVVDALGSLRPADQEILRLRTWEDLSRPETARVLGITPEAVDMRTNRALKRMEKALIGLGYQFNDKEHAPRTGETP